VPTTRFLSALLVLSAACGGGGATGTPSDDVASVTVTPENATITKGATTTLSAVTRDASGNILTGRTVTWVSGTPTIASVANGVVTGMNPGGPVTIIASSEGKSGSAEITVTQPTVATIDMNPSTITLQVGQTVQIVATPRDAAGTAVPVNVNTWSTNNDQVASVTSGGLVTATGVGGPVRISAFAGNASATTMVTVTAPPTVGVTSLALGGYHSCALMSDGSARCWGVNAEGQIGDGSTTARLVPTAVTGGTVFIRLFAGLESTCGLTQAGAGFCWGNGQYGTLGNGSTSDKPSPTAVTSPGEAFALIESAGSGNGMCGVGLSTRIYCWGRDSLMLMGAGTDVLTPTLLPVGATPPVVDLSIGYNFGCGRTAAGAAWCWGVNQYGQLGDGTFTSKAAPVQVAGGHLFTKVQVGTAHACGLQANGTIWCWGNSTFGQRGDGTTTDRNTPVQIPGITDFTNLAVRGGAACGLRGAGTAWCWGNNIAGQVGDGTKVNRMSPVQVGGSHLFSAIALGLYHGCGISTDGVYCWGGNAGQLGDGTTTERLTPVKVVGL